MPRPWQLRPNALAQIHMGKAELGMDDDTYRAMLFAQAGVHSAKDLDATGRNKVLMYLRANGAKFERRSATAPARPAGAPSRTLTKADLLKGRPANPPEHLVPQLGKIEALLADAGRPWAYVNGMCRRMFKIERIEFCHADHLQDLIAALVIDQARRAKRAAADAAAAPTTRKDAA